MFSLNDGLHGVISMLIALLSFVIWILHIPLRVVNMNGSKSNHEIDQFMNVFEEDEVKASSNDGTRVKCGFFYRKGMIGFMNQPHISDFSSERLLSFYAIMTVQTHKIIFQNKSRHEETEEDTGEKPKYTQYYDELSVFSTDFNDIEIRLDTS